MLTSQLGFFFLSFAQCSQGATLQHLHTCAFDNQKTEIMSLASHPQKPLIALVGANHGVVLYDYKKQKQIESPGRFQKSVYAAAFGSNNELAVGLSGGNIELWDILAAKSLCVHKG